MRSLVWKYVAAVERLNRALGAAAMYLLVVVLAVLLFPVFARGGGVSTIWTLETAQFAVGAYYLLGAGFSLQAGAHVRMDFLYSRWSCRVRAAVDAVTSLMAVFYLAVMLAGGWSSCAYAIVSRQVNHTVWAPYMAPVKIAMEIGIFFMLLQMTAETIKSAAVALGRREPSAGTVGDLEFPGRLSRRRFVLAAALDFAAAAAGALVFGWGLGRVTADGGPGLLAVLAGVAVCGMAAIAFVPLMVRRLHDLDMSGWWAAGFLAFALVPGLGLLTTLGAAVLLSRDGAPGMTGFGPDPRGRDLIAVFDPRIPASPPPLLPPPLPAAPYARRSPARTAAVCAALAAASAAAGFAAARATCNPSWFVAGAAAAAFAALIGGVSWLKR